MSDTVTQVTHIDLIPKWERAMSHGLLGGRPFSPATIEVYVYYVTTFLKEHKVLSEESLEDALMSIPPQFFAKREKMYRALVCFGKFLAHKKLLNADFFSQVKSFAPKRHLPPKRKTVNSDGLVRLLQACKTKQDLLIVTILAATGLRASEACALKLQDIDLQTSTLTVRLGKGGKQRRVGLSPNVKEAIQDYLDEAPTRKPTDSLLLNRYNTPMDRHGLYQRLERLSKEAGVNASPHALRRAFVTINANKGRPLQMLQMACGHADITTTRLYCQTTEDEVVQAMTTWNGVG